MTSTINNSSSTAVMPVCKCIDGMHGCKFEQLLITTANRFEKLEIVLCDTLDAHNMAEEGSDLWDMALEVSQQMSQKWLRKHIHYIENSFGSHFNITKWNDLKEDPDFERRFQLVQDMYAQNDDIRNYVEKICSTYVELSAARMEARGELPNRDRMMKQSRNYTLEEVAGTATYYDWFKAPVVYIGSYFDDPAIFQKHNPCPEISLQIPEWHKIPNYELKAAA